MDTKISQINVYPVKSASGISLSNAWVESIGLSFDRRFMVADSTGKFVTGRTDPKMTEVSVSLQANGITLNHPTMSPLVLKYAQFSLQEVHTNVWKDEFNAYSTTSTANAWFSHLLGGHKQLLFSGEESSPRYASKAQTKVSFADGFPLLIISEASLSALNDKTPDVHSMDQFRTNLVVTGCDAFEEDTWAKIRIGSVVFRADCPCSRCIFTTLDLDSGRFRVNGEPITTLSQFRSAEDGNVNFGMNLIAMNEGEIRAGDKIEVLEYRDAEVYEDNTKPKLNLTCHEIEHVAQDFKTFWFENQQGVLPKYKAGQHLPLELDINGKRVQRRYTLSSSPTRPDRFAISVKRVEGGEVSNWLHDEMREGAEVKAQQPDGQFHLSDDNNKRRQILLLSGGSGVTPMMSMLRALSDHNEVDDVIFFHQCRSEADIPFSEELDALAKKHKGLQVMTLLSRPSDEWSGLTGRLSQEHLALVSWLTQREIFVCGPEGFMDAAMTLLDLLGVPESQRHQEFFSPPTMGEGAPAAEVSITLDGEYIRGDNQRPILVQAEEVGVQVDYSCRAGVCGCCKMRLVEGEVHQPDMPALFPGEKEEGLVLACCCVPKGDVVLSKL
ncbi:hybrid-cluster NAD(P)-dependent oxidoreductase [Enterovibrio sp. ZSDZ42]|uniref:Hybrid-cluster NAD(P)-dependent oxidoreductase n=1 Tax=Enterovibrio gelatinilyticus TaxID=2899819 RepID=A0ABT5QYR7_9GAMM|nr:hybrid-cluster NAD(P)-dependent oxidoreductase [Enterovibrio sp. ZSDZ42]MDD1793161.1 hybrid-cluster NAD(P)-dependent oxidoreductase [Enterovibrio sp. ZSDZ42]